MSPVAPSLAGQSLIAQPSLFGSGPPEFDARFVSIERHELTRGAWVDHQPGWVAGHQSLFDELMEIVEWSHQRRPMYDRMVDVPRLIGSLPEPDLGGPDAARRPPALALIDAMAGTLADRYGTAFERVGVALYRDGNDSVAWHGDQVARELGEALVATVSLGEPRPFHLRPKGGGVARRFRVGHGDLIVMGGTCQRTWDHCVPKVARAGPRIALMFRPVW